MGYPLTYKGEGEQLLSGNQAIALTKAPRLEELPCTQISDQADQPGIPPLTKGELEGVKPWINANISFVYTR